MRHPTPEPGLTDLTARYDSGAYLQSAPDWHAGDAAWKAGKIFDLLQARRLNPASVCDVGCGAGEVLAQLQRRMPATTRFAGYDTSETAIAICRAKSNGALTFHHADFLTATAERYDLLLLLDVFEHVPDYLGFLEKLRPRAERFVFHIPLDINATTVLLGSRYMMYMRRKFGHLHYFTKETALATLEETGYRVLHTQFTWDRERDVYPRMPASLAGKLHTAAEWAILTAERLTNRRVPAFWARFRKEYNLLVLAEPRG